jgi:hypothetical protein
MGKIFLFVTSLQLHRNLVAKIAENKYKDDIW